jgi:hypothetical protein
MTDSYGYAIIGQYLGFEGIGAQKAFVFLLVDLINFEGALNPAFDGKEFEFFENILQK